MKDLEDTSCHFESVITLALPSGEDYQIVYETHGYLDKELLAKGYKPGNSPWGRYLKTRTRQSVGRNERQ